MFDDALCKISFLFVKTYSFCVKKNDFYFITYNFVFITYVTIKLVKSYRTPQFSLGLKMHRTGVGTL